MLKMQKIKELADSCLFRLCRRGQRQSPRQRTSRRTWLWTRTSPWLAHQLYSDGNIVEVLHNCITEASSNIYCVVFFV
jgi:hypothetical protein